MILAQIFFILVGLVTLGAALMVVVSRRMMHAALWLILALVGVAITFAMLEASFFAAVQVVVYIGGIAILIIFAIMMTRREDEDATSGLNKTWWGAALVSLLLFGGLVLGLTGWGQVNQVSVPLTNSAADIGEFGKALVDPQGYMIPFEISSVLLLAGLVGSVFIVLDRKGENS